jgi:hypothetical protein
MSDKRKEEVPAGGTEADGDAVAVSLFAHDLSEYAGEWIAATPRGVIAHDSSLRELRKIVSGMDVSGDVRYYAVPAEVQAT